MSINIKIHAYRSGNMLQIYADDFVLNLLISIAT